jgi:K+-sensing histidine kinase KdpD
MDPVTISLVFGAAKTAYEAIKAGIKIGKEIQGMAGDIAKLYGSVAKLTSMSANPPKPKLFSKMSAEEMAMDIVVKRKQAEEWFNQVKNEFVATYGIRGWQEVEKELVRIQKEQKAARERAQKEVEEFQREVMIMCLIGGIVICLIVGVFMVVLSL